MQKLLLSAVSLYFAFAAWQPAAGDGWPQWRGSSQNGVTVDGEYPTQWSEADVTWKIRIPGKGSSTPVHKNDSIYLTSGVDGNNVLVAIDAKDGNLLWQTKLGTDRGNKHKKGGGSNPSPVVEGDSIYAYFRSGDFACVDKTGKVRWQTNLQQKYGEDTLWWDLGSSPMLTQNAVVIAVMQSGPSYLIAFDKSSGDVIWKTDRDLNAPEEAAQSYSTPVSVRVGDAELIAVMGADHLTLHEAKKGKLIGTLGGFNPTEHKYFRSIASPVAQGNVIVCPYARGETVTAVNLEELQDSTGKEPILWFRDDLGSDVPTPAIQEGKVYMVSDKEKGKVYCIDLQTGKTRWTVQIPKSRHSYSSSPLVAGDYLYATAEDATTYVVGPLSSGEPKLIASNKLDDNEPFTVASIAPFGNGLLIRSKSHLYRIDRK